MDISMAASRMSDSISSTSSNFSDGTSGPRSVANPFIGRYSQGFPPDPASRRTTIRDPVPR
jgi:hypothetical protein